jgi:hypothetical protein
MYLRSDGTLLKSTESTTYNSRSPLLSDDQYEGSVYMSQRRSRYNITIPLATSHLWTHRPLLYSFLDLCSPRSRDKDADPPSSVRPHHHLIIIHYPCNLQATTASHLDNPSIRSRRSNSLSRPRILPQRIEIPACTDASRLHVSH